MKELVEKYHEWAPVLEGVHYRVIIQSRESPRDTYEYEFTDEATLREFLESRADYLHSLEVWAIYPGYDDNLILEINGGVDS